MGPGESTASGAHHGDLWSAIGGCGAVGTCLGGVGGDPDVPVLPIRHVQGCAAAAQDDQQEVEDRLDDEA